MLFRSEDFLISLPALWYEYGEHTIEIRATYMQQLTNLVYYCFTKQLGDWCQVRGVEYIGHIIEDDNAAPPGSKANLNTLTLHDALPIWLTTLPKKKCISE